MVLREKTPIVGLLCLIIFVFGTTSGDVIDDLSTNVTSVNGSLGATKKVLSGSSINSNSVECRSNDECQNGGSCADQGNGINTCHCRNGTSGDRCQIADECAKCGVDPGVKCVYNVTTERAECKCLDDTKAFDSYKKMCRVPCKTSKDCEAFAPCRKDIDKALLKFCRCPFGFGGDKCHEEFDECIAAGLDCGKNPNVTCTENGTGQAVCHCPSWSDGYNYEAKDCTKCDCEGRNFGCYFLPGGEKKCYCDKKYYQKDGKCEDCNCKLYSEGCALENGIKRCKCHAPYLDNNGTCERCDCGKNSKDINGCSFENGLKKCTCEDGYIQSDGICKKYCSASTACRNGGECVGNVCKCLSGTKGDRCEIIVGCEQYWEVSSKCGYSDTVKCKFNQTSGKPYCGCIDTFQIFDSYDQKCKSCSCGQHGKCSFALGAKTCDCDEGYAERPGSYWIGESQCSSCDCGIYSTGCRFLNYYEKECSCKPGYADRNDRCDECDCGSNGHCSFDSAGRKVCSCDDGYSEKDGTCAECDCGRVGECVLDEYGRQACNCPQGYGVKYRECTRCTCYMNGVRDVNCTFDYGYQECTCPTGYEERATGFCLDINECTSGRSHCPRDTQCINTEGSYRCDCNGGYKPYGEEYDPKEYGCQDINECDEQNECPYRDTTQCVNTVGSYYCECKKGYYSKFSRYSIEYEGCQVDQTGWKVGYAILIVMFGIISLGLIIAIVKKK